MTRANVKWWVVAGAAFLVALACALWWLRPFAGQHVTISLNNFPDNWFCEAAYWAEITIH